MKIILFATASARELFTRFDTSHFCNTSSLAGIRYSIPNSPLSHGPNWSSESRTGTRSWAAHCRREYYALMRNYS